MRLRAGILVAALAACACASSSVVARPTAGPATPVEVDGTIGGAAYKIEVPSDWNGTLFLYSHGYVAPGHANPAAAAPDGAIGRWLLNGRNAIAGSAYSSTGWAVEDALHDQIALLDHFSRRFGKPSRVVAWGASLGGIITAGLIQEYPDRFAGAMPICGVLAGGVAAWNLGLDGAYAFKTLLAPGTPLQVARISDPAANLELAQQVLASAAQTAAGRARIALIAALTDLPGWFLPTGPEPAPGDYATWAAAQVQWEARVDFAFAFAYRSELERRAGGNPSWNTGVDYRRQLQASADAAEVSALYRDAGLDLGADLDALDAGPRVKADAAAVRYLDRYVDFDGELAVPVLTIHTTGDGLVVPQDETAYGDVAKAAGRSDMLRQLFVRRAGHCAFTPAEIVAGIRVLVERLDTGSWDDAALTPRAMNDAASSLGQAYNALGGLLAAGPAFVDYSAGPYLRPFWKGGTPPS